MGRCGPWVLVLGLLVFPARAVADAVDDAHARGSRAAAEGRWAEAVQAYEDAAALLPQVSATLSYNLGTAHAHEGDLGRATYYLRRALDTQGGPSPEVVELARHNLGEVRRRAEFAAIATGCQIDRPATWWDLLLDALRAPWVGWVALLFGAGLLVTQALARRAGGRRGPWQAAVLVCALGYLIPGALHGLALRADAIGPPAIVLGDRVEARARPGAHAEVGFPLQGGARVRITDRSPGWREVRLPGGLSGWVPESQLGELSSPRPLPPRARVASGKGSETPDG